MPKIEINAKGEPVVVPDNPGISDNKLPGPITPSPTGSGTINQPVQPAGFELDTLKTQDFNPPNTPFVPADSEKPSTVTPGVTTNVPVDAIPPVKKDEPLVGMANKIDEAKRFNSKLSHLTDQELAEEVHHRAVLQNAIGSPDALEKELATGIPGKADRSSRILEVLRNKGMDSQQAQQALVTINDILYDETVEKEVENNGVGKGKDVKSNVRR